MTARMLTLAALLAVFEAISATGTHRGPSMPGSPQNISRNDPTLQKLLFAAAAAFNNQSNDAFLFKPADVIRAQKQIVKGVRFIVDFKISRTVCRKRDHSSDLSACDFQPAGRLQRTLECHLEVWTVPWTHQNSTQKFLCR
ncbi:Cystatin-F [Oryzias melastigma]|uniref:Cystatin-F n=1 Tax=Oryzias melastigma TaxID=30732 RepID=A0A834CSK3_ORYME|nr:Cystatin-F [Oryzias melastigma]